MNHIEAQYISQIRELIPKRHEVTTTTVGTTAKFGRYWLKRFIKELRSYRKFLEYAKANPKNSDSQDEQFFLRVFDR